MFCRCDLSLKEREGDIRKQVVGGPSSRRKAEKPDRFVQAPCHHLDQTETRGRWCSLVAFRTRESVVAVGSPGGFCGLVWLSFFFVFSLATEPHIHSLTGKTYVLGSTFFLTVGSLFFSREVVSENFSDQHTLGATYSVEDCL